MSNEPERQIYEAMTIAAEAVCEARCPSKWKTSEPQPHSDECCKVKAARSAWMDHCSTLDLIASGGLPAAEGIDGDLGAAKAEIERLKAECFALAANQCHAGYGDDWGNHRCEKIDGLKDALLGLIEAVELDGDKGGKGISGYTAARLTDARAALSRS